MKTIDLGQTAQILASLGVIAGIVFLAIELKQNTASVRAGAYQTWASATSDHFGTAQNNDSMSLVIAKGLEDPSSLTNDNWVQFAFWCHQFVRITETTYYLHKEGIIADAVYLKELERTASLLSVNVGGAQWWSAGARTQYSEEFVRAIESRFGEQTSFQNYKFTEGRGFHPPE